eukprot:TRINITY_DN6078_c0_g1_i2.p1 TRINITY_DN6078_c0_g1~~TRINITY_DN6078_c0_g1_i2.p1  ORF type:complete len:600 (+),score=55.26 TRINITY_DN6078_c0_g1_i2:235-1800(+)
MSRTSSPDQFKQNLMELLLQLLQHVQPTKSLSIMLDGPAPLSKLSLQRSRRLISFSRNIYQKRKRKTVKGKRVRHGGIKQEQQFDQKGENSFEGKLSVLGITPGTKFMAWVKVVLEEIIADILSLEKYSCLLIRFSDSSEAGEGEVKIIRQIVQDKEDGKDDVHVVVGNDSDLILMSIACGNPNVYVLQGTWRRDLMSQKQLVKLWGNDRSNFLDFVMLVIISFGNDYLPSVRGIQSSSIITAYRKMRISQKYENTPLIQQKLSGEIEFNFEMMRELFERVGAVKKSKQEYQKYYVETCQNYFIQLKWNLGMYVNGKCGDYFINHDLRNISTYHFSALFSSGEFSEIQKYLFQQSEPLPPFACGIAMLPIGVHHLLPIQIQQYYQEKYQNLNLNQQKQMQRNLQFYTVESVKQDVPEILKFKNDNQFDENDNYLNACFEFSEMVIYYNNFFQEKEAGEKLGVIQNNLNVNNQYRNGSNGSNIRLININKKRAKFPQQQKIEKYSPVRVNSQIQSQFQALFI